MTFRRVPPACLALLATAAACAAPPAPSDDAASASIAQAYARAQFETEADRVYAANVAGAQTHASHSASAGQAILAPATTVAGLRSQAIASPQTQTASSGARSVLFGVHVASYRSQASAAAGWSLLAAAPGTRDALAGLAPRVDHVDLGAGKGEFERLKAGPLASRAEAEARCLALRTAGAYCQVTDFEGRDLLVGADYAQTSPPRADSGH